MSEVTYFILSGAKLLTH